MYRIIMSFQSNLLFLLLPFCTSSQDCKKTNRKIVPFMVPLSTQEGECHGIIVSRSCILTSAKCVNGSNSVDVHLTNRKGILPGANVSTAKEIIAHDNFRKVTSTRYQNDFALLKLPLPINFSLSLRPAAFLLNDTQHEFSLGTVAEAVVWRVDGDLTITQGAIQASNSCVAAFQQDFNPFYHFCIMFSEDIFITHIDDGSTNHPVLINNNIVGFAIPYPVYAEMGKIYRASKISPVVKWMAQHTTTINNDITPNNNNYLYDDIENCLFQNILPESSSITFKSILQQLIRNHLEAEVNNEIRGHATAIVNLKSVCAVIANATQQIQSETEKRFDATEKQLNAKAKEIHENINAKYALIQAMLATKEADIIKRIVEKFSDLQAKLEEKGRQLDSVSERLSKLEQKLIMASLN